MLGFCAKREARHIYYTNKLKDAESFGSIRHHILLRPYMLTNDFPYNSFCYYTLVSSPISRPPYTEIRTIYALPYGEHIRRNCYDKINPGQAHAVRASTSCSLVGTPYCMQTILLLHSRFVTHFFGPIYEGRPIYALPFSEHIKRYLHGGIKTGVIQRNDRGSQRVTPFSLSLSPSNNKIQIHSTVSHHVAD